MTKAMDRSRAGQQGLAGEEMRLTTAWEIYQRPYPRLRRADQIVQRFVREVERLLAEELGKQAELVDQALGTRQAMIFGQEMDDDLKIICSCIEGAYSTDDYKGGYSHSDLDRAGREELSQAFLRLSRRLKELELALGKAE
jgi:hypothetical protein